HNNQVPIWNMGENFTNYADPPHGWGNQHLNFDPKCDPNNFVYRPDGEHNTGFVQQYQDYYPHGYHGIFVHVPSPANIPMGYYTRKALPVLYSLADKFCICDRWFSSLLSSTWPNRKYLLSGYRDSDRDTGTFPPLPPGFETVPFLDALENTIDRRTGNKYTSKCY